MIAALLLAAGRSIRMGEQNKLLLSYRGKPLIKHVSETLLGCDIDGLWVVLGYQREQLDAELPVATRLHRVHNPDHEEGMASSLRAGLGALSHDSSADAVMVVQADMPLLHQAHFQMLITASEANNHNKIIAPYFAGRRGNPVIFPRRFFAEMSSLKGDAGARGLLKKYEADVVSVDMPDDAVLIDIDDPDDWQKTAGAGVMMLREQFPFFAAEELCYLDSAATSLAPAVVLEAMQFYELHQRGNVRRGAHRQADRAAEAYEKARQQVADYLGGCDSRQVVFTPGTTAGLNGLAASLAEDLSAGDEILLSAAEHHSNLLPWMRLAEQHDLVIKKIPLAGDARLDLSTLDMLVGERTRIVSVTHASNVTGAITDLAPIVEAARRVNALVIVDGAQRVPHGPLDVEELEVDAYLFSGHKCYGPSGVGVLWGTQAFLESLPPIVVGGGMVSHVGESDYRCLPIPARHEAGTPPVAQAVGLGAALEWLQGLDWGALDQAESDLTERALSELRAVPGLRLIGPDDSTDRLPLFSFTLEGCHPHDIAHVLNDEGVAVRAGHLCAEPLLEAVGEHAVTRISFGLYNLDANGECSDLERFVAALERVRALLL